MRLRTKYTERLPVAPGLRLDIPMFEGSGTKVLDLSGKGNHGTITDAVWTRDENGVAMSFNGTSAYIDCGNDASLNATDAVTIEAWVKLNVIMPIDNPAFVSKNHATSWDCILREGKTGKLGFYINNVNRVSTASNAISQDTWHHIVWSYDKDLASEQVKIYVDGSKSASGTYTAAIGTDNDDVLIGKYMAQCINGTIDEVRIYAVALTAEQIKRRYEQTKRNYVRAS